MSLFCESDTGLCQTADLLLLLCVSDLALRLKSPLCALAEGAAGPDLFLDLFIVSNSCF
jgi:hypothetical protein